MAVNIADPDDPSRYLGVRGRVVESTTEGGAEHIEELSQKYLGRPYPNFSGLRRGPADPPDRRGLDRPCARWGPALVSSDPPEHGSLLTGRSHLFAAGTASAESACSSNFISLEITSSTLRSVSMTNVLRLIGSAGSHDRFASNCFATTPFGSESSG